MERMSKASRTGIFKTRELSAIRTKKLRTNFTPKGPIVSRTTPITSHNNCVWNQHGGG